MRRARTLAATLSSLAVAVGVAVHDPAATELSDATWAPLDDGVQVRLVLPATLPAMSTVEIVLPAVTVLEESAYVRTVPTTHATRHRRGGTVLVTTHAAAPAGLMAITLDALRADALRAGAVRVFAPNGTELYYGVLSPVAAHTTQVTARVLISATFGVDVSVAHLGTLSPLRVATARQRYVVNVNNASGAHIVMAADGPLRTAHGDEIPDVRDGIVRAGVPAYGMRVTATPPLSVHGNAAARDVPVPRTPKVIAGTRVPVSGAVLDITYKVGINAQTPPGAYGQTVAVSVIPSL